MPIVNGWCQDYSGLIAPYHYIQSAMFSDNVILYVQDVILSAFAFSLGFVISRLGNCGSGEVDGVAPTCVCDVTSRRWKEGGGGPDCMTYCLFINCTWLLRCIILLPHSGTNKYLHMFHRFTFTDWDFLLIIFLLCFCISEVIF